MDADELTRRKLLAGAGGLAAGAAVLETTGEPATAAVTGPRLLGMPAHGEHAIEVIGVLVQEGDALTGHGYLTRVSGLSDNVLFTGSSPDEAGARFTFSAAAKVVSLSAHGAVFSSSGIGTIDFFLDRDGGGDFGAPATFADGTRIARYAARFQNVLTVIAPNQAVIALEGDLIQRQATAFSLDGGRYQLGRRRLRVRLGVHGLGTRTDATIPRAGFDVAGALVLAG
jgi:hypothetical protein